MSRQCPVLSLFGTALTVVIVVSACSRSESEPPTEKEVSESTMEITSTAFVEGGSIPAKFTCDGEDFSPPLRISGTPGGTRTMAIIADDPDAPGGTYVHWVVYGISPDTAELPENYAARLSASARHGTNDFRKQGYGGPCPPRGNPHRYFFKVYAVDKEINLNAGATKAELLREMEGSILASGQLMGTYQRR